MSTLVKFSYEEKIKALRKALLLASNYIGHQSDCSFDVRGSTPDSDFCTCGFAAMKAEVRRLLNV